MPRTPRPQSSTTPPGAGLPNSRRRTRSRASFTFAVALFLVLGGAGSRTAEKLRRPAASHGMHQRTKMMHHTKASAEVKVAQKALNKAGFKVRVDGVMGRHTCAAIEAFQKAGGLKVTGRLDKETLAKLHTK